MILNYDCFRDVLLYIEEQDNMKLNGDFKRIMLKDIKDHFSGKYTEEDVQYCVKNLFDGRFLEGSYSIDDNYKYENCKIYDVTFEGHKLAESIRPDSIWRKSKAKLKSVGISSINMISAVCVEVAKVAVTDLKFITDIANGIFK